MKCRAKMIDGSPVTFEHVDQGEVEFYRGVSGAEYWSPSRTSRIYLTEMIGEGFYVRGIHPNYSLHAQGNRVETDRAALERSGVDTATVEYWEVHQDGIFTRVEQKKPGIISFECGHWAPLFPPVVRQPEMKGFTGFDPLPGRITYVDHGPRLPALDDGISQAINDGYTAYTGNHNLGRPFAASIYHRLLAHLSKSKSVVTPTVYYHRDGSVHFHPEEIPTEEMIEAGYETWREIDLTEGRRFTTTHGVRKTVAGIWRAMEKARTK